MQLNKNIGKRIRNNRGFTLIEVIAVLVILAILAAVAISRSTATEEANLKAGIDTLKSHLRYAQNLAMNEIYDTEAASSQYATRTKWGINVVGSSYSLVKYVADVSSAHTYSLPGESSATHNFISGISASSSLNPVLFDDWGSSGNVNITITIGGQTITIMAGTGFIP
jgi:prepilin-type N-terminal cleavage/methylation domain-containing protein